jgi:hypothetical protein
MHATNLNQPSDAKKKKTNNMDQPRKTDSDERSWSKGKKDPPVATKEMRPSEGKKNPLIATKNILSSQGTYRN